MTPQISADGYVHLSIVPAVAGRSEIVSESDSIVRVRLEQTVMISALPNGYRRLEEWLVLLTPAIAGPALVTQTGEPFAGQPPPEARHP